MKTATLTTLLVIGVMHVGTGIAAPPTDLANAALVHTRTTEGFAVLDDGARYQLGNRLGLFVDYKELKPASGALSALQTDLPAMPPVRLGGFIVSAGIRVYLK